jgi:hypothetical protein
VELAQRELLRFLAGALAISILVIAAPTVVSIWVWSWRPYIIALGRAFAIIWLSIAVISAINLWVLPWGPVDNLLLTPVPTVLAGTACGAAATAYSSTRALLQKSAGVNFAVAVLSALIALVLIFYFSMFIVLNIKGS